MITFKKKSPVILYLHGFKSHPGDSIENILSQQDDYNITSIFLDPLKPEQTYKDVIKASRDVDLVIGFSMGGYWESLIPNVDKLFINPAFLFPYILLYKTNSRDLFERYLNLSKNQFLGETKNSSLIYWKNDKTDPLSLFNTFYKGRVIDSLKSHIPSNIELKNIIIPEIYNMIIK